MHVDALAKVHGLVETEPSEADTAARLEDVIVSAVPRGQLAGQRRVNGPLSDRRCPGLGQQAIQNVWKDKGLSQCFSGGSGNHECTCFVSSRSCPV